MPTEESHPVIRKVLIERQQDHETRKNLFAELEKKLERPIVSFFTSFVYPVMIEDADADMLEGILQKIDLSRGLALMISSPGGDGLAAERIVNVLRAYSGEKGYWVIVPGKAKSAATMICFGAGKIIMSATSELGPVDPQITIPAEGGLKRFSVYNIVDSYNQLFMRAVKEKGNLQPYLQQLANYDEREIREFRAALELSEDITIRSLSSGMMKGKKRTYIKEKIKIFLTPERVKTHGRPIYMKEASNCELKIESKDVKEEFWELVYELYIRTDQFVQTMASKAIESKEHSYIVPVKKG
jgi:hypothetical protein